MKQTYAYEPYLPHIHPVVGTRNECQNVYFTLEVTKWETFY